jgi:hypothetical protein
MLRVTLWVALVDAGRWKLTRCTEMASQGLAAAADRLAERIIVAGMVEFQGKGLNMVSPGGCYMMQR